MTFKVKNQAQFKYEGLRLGLDRNFFNPRIEFQSWN